MLSLVLPALLATLRRGCPASRQSTTLPRRRRAASPISAAARLLRTLHPPSAPHRSPCPYLAPVLAPSRHLSPRDVHRRRRGRPRRLSSWTTTRPTRVEVALTRSRSRTSRSRQRRQRCTPTRALHVCASRLCSSASLPLTRLHLHCLCSFIILLYMLIH